MDSPESSCLQTLNKCYYNSGKNFNEFASKDKVNGVAKLLQAAEVNQQEAF